jgi:transposase
MHSTTVAVDLAKNVFELAVADCDWRIDERLRLNRSRFSAFFVHRSPCLFVMEACGSAHYWARRIATCGHEVRLLPAQYVRAYVKRNKTDRADAAALLEALRCADIRPVPVKTLAQQQVLALHRLRSQWMSTRHRYINTLRGILREFGIAIALGVTAAKTQIAHTLTDSGGAVPSGVVPLLAQMLDEIKAIEHNIDRIECELANLSGADERVQQMRQIPALACSPARRSAPL